LATGGGGMLDSSPFAGDDVLTGDEGSTEPVSPASITIGGISLNALLSGPDVPIATDQGGLEQVAELVPLPESSLALAATLWTVPSDSPTSSTQWEASAGMAIDPDGRNASTSSWVLFVTGMDEALEQTSRDIRDSILSRDGRRAGNKRAPDAPDELVDWQGPILPAARGGLSEMQPSVPRTSPGVTLDEARQGTVRNQQDSRPRSDDAQPVVLAVMPMISAVSISTLIAGWFWRKCRRARRSVVNGTGASDRSIRDAITR